MLPDSWLAPSATGSPEKCVSAIQNQFNLGCDGVIMHGVTPEELTPIVAAYRAFTGSRRERHYALRVGR